MIRSLGVVILLLSVMDLAYAEQPLVDLAVEAPSVTIEMRYFGNENFVGRPIDGYLAPKCLLTKEAAASLARAQQELMTFGLSLKVYDCYRPQPAVDHFMRWTRDADDVSKKSEYYPSVVKSRLVPEGYIAERSGHSRGSTVDLTLIDLSTREELPMGTPWDFFDPLSNTENKEIDIEERRNRLLLRSVLSQHGFDNYWAEWWHFTLRNEPLPDSYLSIPVE